MITKMGEPYVRDPNANGREVRELTGLSTDTKPTNVRNGSTFFEMDTKKAFMYDETNNQWREL